MIQSYIYILDIIFNVYVGLSCISCNMVVRVFIYACIHVCLYQVRMNMLY